MAPVDASPAGEWLELSTEVEAEAVESVSAAFAEWGQGVAINQPVESSRDGDDVRYPTDLPFTVTTYLSLLAPDTPGRRGQIEKAVWALGQLRQVGPLVVRTLREEDWANAWKAYFFVHRVGTRTVIVPTWRTADYVPRPNDVVLLLDPGMAFGTGLHPTTRLCLTELETLDLLGQTVLDLGAGSGILAISAAKQGAAHVDAVEIDPVATRVCQENIEANGVSALIRVVTGSLESLPSDHSAYTVVLANITIRVLLELASSIEAQCAPGALALLSGVLEERASELTATLEQRGWRHLATRQEQDWIAVLFRLP